MIAGEYGNVLTINAGIDISAATNIVIKVKYNGTVTEIDTGITVGLLDITTPCGDVFEALQYAQYTILQTDFTVAGKYRAWLEFDLDGKHRITTAGIFEVIAAGA